MPNCPTCGFDNTFGALVCAKCHTLLIELKGDQYTTTLPNPLPSSEAESTVRRAIRDTSTLGTDSVALYIDSSETPMVIDITQQAIFGRYTPDATLRPRVDLSPYGAYERGISRMHAAIRRTPEGLVVEDLASSNGTWINEVKLQAYVPTPLRSGDRIKLGQLEIEVYFRESQP
jgi:pSer/pThr/pTyr-binding forkhead associated (FHA) protein